MIDKKTLSERDICTKFITPAVEKAGWNKITQLLEEVTLPTGKYMCVGSCMQEAKEKSGLYFILQAKHSYCYYRG